MILAAVPWLNISINLLLIVFVIVALLMSLLILMQRPKQEGLGAAFGSGVTDQVFGARTTNVLQRGTVYLASLFFILTLTLAILYAKQNEYKATLAKDEEPAAEEITTEEEAMAPDDMESLEEVLEEAAGGEELAEEDPAPALEPDGAVGPDVPAAEDEPGEAPGELSDQEAAAGDQNGVQEDPVEAESDDEAAEDDEPAAE